MPAHTCHVPPCSTPCPPAHLTCGACWKLVPRALQAKVYRTVHRRGAHIDASWAPWWRAQAEAIDAVLRKRWPEEAERWDQLRQRELAFADELEADD